MRRTKRDVETPLFTEKYTKTLGEFICNKVEEGISVRQLCKDAEKYGVPREKTIYRWCKKYPEFGENMMAARKTWFLMQIDELDELSKELMIANKALETCEKDEASAKRLYADSVKIRIDTLKFSLAKMAGRFVPEMQDQQNQTVLPVINIISYAKEDLKKLKDITPDVKQISQ